MSNASLHEMVSSSGLSSEQTARVLRVLEEYLAELERGGRPHPDALLARHPDLADLLKEYLDRLDLLHEAAVRFRVASSSLSADGRSGEGSDAAHHDLGRLGDFQLLREVGRGGMGIVYEAEQISLNRRVALKVLPFAATLDARPLQRFQNEARAAACLHHEHIVPVYGVGCERGVHYYAMQFIEGQTLAALIEQQRTGTSRAYEPTTDVPAPSSSPPPDGAGRRMRVPAADTVPVAAAPTDRASRDGAYFRRVAEWGIQAAQALEHAHALGIVHRDVKPGNLMVDGQGKLWVTDFGLARTAVDMGLTLTGDVVGTLRYMSPEQAMAQHGLVDHRTDVYALGATLYELLTLQPAVMGDDRRKMLNALSEEEPIKPRSLNRFVPTDLETILLKALPKNPAERYASAQQFADDLRRFLLRETIWAKKPTWLQRASKWTRRHPAAVRSATLILILSAFGSSLSTWLVWQEKRIAEERDAETKAVLGFVESRIIAVARPQGQEGGLGSEVTLRRALEEALPFVDSSFPGQPLIEARLRRTLGLSFHYLGDDKVAVQQFEAAQRLLSTHRGRNHPDTLAIVNNLANSYAALGRLDESIQLREETLAERKQALGPDDPATLDSMTNLANSYDALGQPLKALKLRQETLALQQAKFGPDHAATLASMNNLAVSYTTLGHHKEALKLREETLARLRAKAVPDFSRMLAAMNNLAQSYQALARYGEALPMFEATLVLAKEKLKDDHPNALIVKNNLAWLLATADDIKFRDSARAAELANEAVRASLNTADFWGTRGTARYRTGAWKDAAADLDKAIGLRGPGDCRNANESFFLAMAHWQLGDEPAARKSFNIGTAWMDKGKLRNDEVRRFRAEAAKLLGVKGESKRPDQETPR